MAIPVRLFLCVLRNFYSTPPCIVYIPWSLLFHKITSLYNGSSLDCQNDLSKSISKINPKSKLFVIREGPQTVFPKLFKAWKVTHVVFEKDTDNYPRQRDAAIAEAARKAGVEVIVRSGRTLWDSDDIVKAHKGKPTMSLSQLQAASSKVGDIARPIPAPKSLPNPGETPLDFEQEQPMSKPDINDERRPKEDVQYNSIAGPKGDFAPETMQELGFPAATTPHRGGESIALKILDNILKDKLYTAKFEKPKTSPAQFEPQATTLFSPFLHFGALSVREFYWRVQDVVDAYGKGASSPPVSLTGQLLFRDMYFAAQAAIGPPFQQTATNPHVRFIPWHLPSKRHNDTGLVTGEYHVDNQDAERWFRRWKEGVTGFPWIDALMRQLKQTGWIHHLGRHSVACFLTRGGCYVDWERGAEVFEKWLLDHEPACNAGNWQWLSCTAFFAQYYRCYSPVSFGQKWDKDGDLIRKYVPELKDLDSKYIYEPWKAPVQDQKRAGVRITGNGLTNQEKGTYPKPMFDFNERRQVCISAMKTAYGVGLHGNDKKVLDGSWRESFPSPGEEEVMGNYESDHHDNSEREDNEALFKGEGGPQSSDERVVDKSSDSTPAKKKRKTSTRDESRITDFFSNRS